MTHHSTHSLSLVMRGSEGQQVCWKAAARSHCNPRPRCLSQNPLTSQHQHPCICKPAHRQWALSIRCGAGTRGKGLSGWGSEHHSLLGTTFLATAETQKAHPDEYCMGFRFFHLPTSIKVFMTHLCAHKSHCLEHCSTSTSGCHPKMSAFLHSSS